MRWWRKASVGLKVAVIATVVLALSIVGVLAAEQRDSASRDDAAKARETDTGTPKPDEVKFRGKPLALGTVAKISSNYRVAVTELSRYEVPSGQVLAVTIDATYIGKEDGEPWADLNAEYAVSGTKTFGESGCPFDLGDADPADQPALQPGDKAAYAVCLELPDIDIERGRISVHEAFSTSDRISWSTEEAVTKRLPSAARAAPSGTRAPASGSQPDNTNRSNAACADFDDEELEEYKEWGDEMKKQFRAYKDAGGNDQDDIDDFEEWEDAYDKQIEQFEKLDEIC